MRLRRHAPLVLTLSSAVGGLFAFAATAGAASSQAVGVVNGTVTDDGGVDDADADAGDADSGDDDDADGGDSGLPTVSDQGGDIAGYSDDGTAMQAAGQLASAAYALGDGSGANAVLAALESWASSTQSQSRAAMSRRGVRAAATTGACADPTIANPYTLLQQDLGVSVAGWIPSQGVWKPAVSPITTGKANFVVNRYFTILGSSLTGERAAYFTYNASTGRYVDVEDPTSYAVYNGTNGTVTITDTTGGLPTLAQTWTFYGATVSGGITTNWMARTLDFSATAGMQLYTQYQYDPCWRLVGATTTNAPPSPSASILSVTSYQYDQYGRLLQVNTGPRPPIYPSYVGMGSLDFNAYVIVYPSTATSGNLLELRFGYNANTFTNAYLSGTAYALGPTTITKIDFPNGTSGTNYIDTYTLDSNSLLVKDATPTNAVITYTNTYVSPSAIQIIERRTDAPNFAASQTTYSALGTGLARRGVETYLVPDFYGTVDATNPREKWVTANTPADAWGNGTYMVTSHAVNLPSLVAGQAYQASFYNYGAPPATGARGPLASTVDEQNTASVITYDANLRVTQIATEANGGTALQLVSLTNYLSGADNIPGSVSTLDGLTGESRVATTTMTVNPAGQTTVATAVQVSGGPQTPVRSTLLDGNGNVITDQDLVSGTTDSFPSTSTQYAYALTSSGWQPQNWTGTINGQTYAQETTTYAGPWVTWDYVDSNNDVSNVSYDTDGREIGGVSAGANANASTAMTSTLSPFGVPLSQTVAYVQAQGSGSSNTTQQVQLFPTSADTPTQWASQTTLDSLQGPVVIETYAQSVTPTR